MNMDQEPFPVCFHCFRLKYISVASNNLNDGKCPSCNENFVSMNIVMGNNNMPFEVREPMKNSKIEICPYINLPQSCTHARTCLFAHNDYELRWWQRKVTRARPPYQCPPKKRFDNPNSPRQPNFPRNPDQYPFETERNKPTVNMQLPSQRNTNSERADIIEKSLKFQNEIPPQIKLDVRSQYPFILKIEASKSPKIFVWSFHVFSITNTHQSGLNAIVVDTPNIHNFTLCNILYKDTMTNGQFTPVDLTSETPCLYYKFPKIRPISSTCSVKFSLQFKTELGEFFARLILDHKNFFFIERIHVIIHRGSTYNSDVESSIHEQIGKQINLNSTSAQIDELLWEKVYQVLTFDYPGQIPYSNEYISKLPANIEESINNKNYEKVLNQQLTENNYKLIFKWLLYIEECACRKNLSLYDLKNQQINRNTVSNQITVTLKNEQETLYGAKDKFSFIKFEMCQSLFEGYHFVRPPDIALIKPKGETKVVYYCHKVEIGHDYIWFAISNEAIQACEKQGGLADVRFKENSMDYHFFMMHQALLNLDPGIMFPSASKTHQPSNISRIKFQDIFEFVEKTKTSKSQKKALFNVLEDYSQINIPTIISGPFGCGKTWTLAHIAALLFSKSDTCRLLICAFNNSSANKYIEDLDKLSKDFNVKFDELTPGGLTKLFRLFSPFRYARTELLRRYTSHNANFSGIIPNQADLQSCKVIVTTTFTCPYLIRMGLPKNFFSHILIDEAAHITEPEIAISLSLAGPTTKIVLTGDRNQIKLNLSSPIARHYELSKTLLERFLTLPEYSENLIDQDIHKCIIHLNENFRSTPEIAKFLSHLYYEGTVIPMRAQPDLSADSLKVLSFYGLQSKEKRLLESPDFSNDFEAKEVLAIVDKLLKSKTFSPEEICIISVNSAQMHLIRNYLRSHNAGKVEVVKLEAIQGRDFRVLIVSTVRTVTQTSESNLLNTNTLGLLEDKYMLNTILSRARDHIIIVGNPYALCTVGSNRSAWQRYIQQCINSGSFYLGGKQTFKFDLIENSDSKIVDPFFEATITKLLDAQTQSIKNLVSEWQKTVIQNSELNPKLQNVLQLADRQFEILKQQQNILKSIL